MDVRTGRSGPFNINGGTIDGAVIGGTTPAAITGTAIVGTTINGTTSITSTKYVGAPTIVHAGGIPLIGLSSGSVAANGAISAITALPVAYPNAYCYFPANALATSIAAGWYYCTFSTTTAGVAFLNTYTSGVPTIPGSPTAVTDGRGAFTGDNSTEEMGLSISIPALAATSQIRISQNYFMSNTAGTKTIRWRFSGAGGTIFISHVTASLASGGWVARISNTGATGKQISQADGHAGTAPTVGVLGTIDTSAATTLVLSAQRNTSTDNVILLPPTVEVLF